MHTIFFRLQRMFISLGDDRRKGEIKDTWSFIDDDQPVVFILRVISVSPSPLSLAVRQIPRNISYASVMFM